MQDKAIKDAHSLCDEILIGTVLRKDWDYKRIAILVIDKQIETLTELYNITENSSISFRIEELEQIRSEIKKIKG